VHLPACSQSKTFFSNPMTYLQRIHAVQNLMIILVVLCILTTNTDLLVTMDMRVVIHKKLLNLNFSYKIIFWVAAATAAVCIISPYVLPYSNRLWNKKHAHLLAEGKNWTGTFSLEKTQP
jgi:hypothetical protein